MNWILIKRFIIFNTNGPPAVSYLLYLADVKLMPVQINH